MLGEAQRRWLSLRRVKRSFRGEIHQSRHLMSAVVYLDICDRQTHDCGIFVPLLQLDLICGESLVKLITPFLSRREQGASGLVVAVDASTDLLSTSRSAVWANSDGRVGRTLLA